MADISKLSFDSEFRYERIAIKGHADFSVFDTFNTQTLTIAHNLGYKPYVKAWIDWGINQLFILFPGSASGDIPDGEIETAYVDNNNFVVTIVNLGPAGGTVAGTVYYRIYQEQLA